MCGDEYAYQLVSRAYEKNKRIDKGKLKIVGFCDLDDGVLSAAEIPRSMRL